MPNLRFLFRMPSTLAALQAKLQANMGASAHTGRWERKVIVVTGASCGIGHALARQLLQQGAAVTGVARRLDRLEAMSTEFPGHFLPVAGDVADPLTAERAVEASLDKFGRVDAVVANAGISMNAQFVSTDVQVFHRLMDVNYFGSLHFAKAAYPHLLVSGGTFVFVSSIVGKRGFATRSGYSAAKFAVHGLFESLRTEWRGNGISVLLVAPGYTATEIRQTALAGDGTPRGKDGTTSGTVMTPDAAAAAIVNAMESKSRETILGAGGRWLVRLNHVFPRVADAIAARVVG